MSSFEAMLSGAGEDDDPPEAMEAALSPGYLRACACVGFDAFAL